MLQEQGRLKVFRYEVFNVTALCLLAGKLLEGQACFCESKLVYLRPIQRWNRMGAAFAARRRCNPVPPRQIWNFRWAKLPPSGTSGLTPTFQCQMCWCICKPRLLLLQVKANSWLWRRPGDSVDSCTLVDISFDIDKATCSAPLDVTLDSDGEGERLRRCRSFALCSRVGQTHRTNLTSQALQTGLISSHFFWR